MNYYTNNILKKITIVFFLFSFGNASAQAHQKVDTTNFHVENSSLKKLYINSETITCLNTAATIISFCEAKAGEEENSHCRKQTIIFSDALNDAAKSYKYRDENPSFIYTASCHLKNNKPIYLFDFSNLGNCKNGCEWTDVYSSHGKLLATNRSRAGFNKLKSKNKFNAYQKNNTTFLRSIDLQKKQSKDNYAKPL